MHRLVSIQDQTNKSSDKMYHQEQSGAKFSVNFLIDEWKKSDKNWGVTVAKKISDTFFFLLLFKKSLVARLFR